MVANVMNLSYGSGSETNILNPFNIEEDLSGAIHNATSLNTGTDLSFLEESISISFQVPRNIFISSTDVYTKPNINEINELVVDIIGVFKWFKDDLYNSKTNQKIKKELEKYISRNSECSLAAIKIIMIKGQLDDSLLNEMLIQIGRIEDEETKFERLDLLKRLLFHNSMPIRDGSILGLSFINDKNAIPSLRDALLRETNIYLKDDISMLLDELDESRDSLLS